MPFTAAPAAYYGALRPAAKQDLEGAGPEAAPAGRVARQRVADAEGIEWMIICGWQRVPKKEKVLPG